MNIEYQWDNDYKQFINNKTNNMNDTCNQKQETESAIKYLTDKRTKASPVIEINIEDYNKLIEENAKLKASKDVVRYEDSYDGETVVSYVGTNKALTDLNKRNEELESEIRKLNSKREISIKDFAKRTEEYNELLANLEKKHKEEIEEIVEKKVKKIDRDYKFKIRDLENAIEDGNDALVDANARNRILSDMNLRYKSTLNRILDYVSKKRRLFKSLFGLKVLLTATNDYRVTNTNNYCTPTFITRSNGASYYA